MRIMYKKMVTSLCRGHHVAKIKTGIDRPGLTIIFCLFFIMRIFHIGQLRKEI